MICRFHPLLALARLLGGSSSADFSVDVHDLLPKPVR
jgi:hypothetical protein